MRLHLVSLPHTATTKAYEWCAYTAKVRKFANMMSSLDHEVILYAAEENEAECVELVPIATPGSDMIIPTFDAADPMFAGFNRRAVGEISHRIESGDYLCLIGGRAQAPIAEVFPFNRIVEFGVGYGGVLPQTFRVFESYAWMHMVYGSRSGGDPHTVDGRFYDAVIPNSFEVDDFPAGDHDGGYLVYLGRMVERKGMDVAARIAEEVGLPLHTAGIGVPPAGVHHHGVVGPKARAELLGGAVALLAPTLYVEPFGGAVCEAQLTGCPTITTDWGAFTETVQHGFNGYRCRTLGEFVAATGEVADLDYGAIRESAMRYSTENVRWRYESFFEQLGGLDGEGWYSLAPGRLGIRVNSDHSESNG